MDENMTVKGEDIEGEKGGEEEFNLSRAKAKHKHKLHLFPFVCLSLGIKA